MICELIESVNHFCMLFASPKYMYDLPAEASDTPRDTRSAKVNSVLTPREELNNPVQDRADTLAQGNLMLEEEENEIQARSPAPKRNVAGETAVFSCRDVKQGLETLFANSDRISRNAAYVAVRGFHARE